MNITLFCAIHTWHNLFVEYAAFRFAERTNIAEVKATVGVIHIP